MRPLEGVRIVEVGMWAFVPSAGAVLSEWGAEIVKVEPLSGDPVRGLAYAGIDADYKGVGFMWESFNRGKKSIAVDLKTAEGQAMLYRLIDHADVFITSLLPPARASMGVDADAIRGRNAAIVYASGSGSGPHGEDAEKPGFDAMSFWARGSVSSALTAVGEWPAGMPTGAFGDVLSGLALAGAVSAALVRRGRTGEGTTVDVSLLGTAIWAMQTGITGAALKEVDELPKMDRGALRNPLVANYQTQDKRYLSLSMLQSDRYWSGLCQAIGHPELADDVRFLTHELRDVNSVECAAALDDIFAEHPLSHWRSVLASQAGPWDVVQTMGELSRDAQARANGYVQTVSYPGTDLQLATTPARFGGVLPSAEFAPELGADSDTILNELGYSDEEILQARISNVLN
jgi:crotonobetainyl-CoA:carnitine CoA-transferase CaiB-like acyl-CoA transferase